MNLHNRFPELKGRRILVVEDWLLVANEIEALLAELRCEVVGTVAELSVALDVAQTRTVDAAILDININGDEVYPVADELMARGIPFAFMTGYGEQNLPKEFKQFPRLEKPFSADDFASALCSLVGADAPQQSMQRR